MKKFLFARAFLALAGSAWADLSLNTSLRDYTALDLTNSSSYDTPSTAFSFSLRFIQGASDIILSDGDDSVGFYCKADYYGYFKIYVGGSIVVQISSPTVNWGGWNILIVTKDDTGVWHVYLNGTEATYSTYTTANTSTRGTQHLYINPNANSNYNCDFQWYNRVLSGSEILNLESSTPIYPTSPISWWPMQETSGKILSDQEGLHNGSVAYDISNFYLTNNPGITYYTSAPSATATPTYSQTPTATPTPTASPSFTATFTPTPTATASSTITETPTITPTPMGMSYYNDFSGGVDPPANWTKFYSLAGTETFTGGGIGVISTDFNTLSASEEAYWRLTASGLGLNDYDFKIKFVGISGSPSMAFGVRDGYWFKHAAGAVHFVSANHYGVVWGTITTDNSCTLSPGDLITTKIRGTGSGTTVEIWQNDILQFAATNPSGYHDTGNPGIGISEGIEFTTWLYYVSQIEVDDLPTATPTASPTATITPTITQTSTVTPTSTVTSTCTMTPIATPIFYDSFTAPDGTSLNAHTPDLHPNYHPLWIDSSNQYQIYDNKVSQPYPAYVGYAYWPLEFTYGVNYPLEYSCLLQVNWESVNRGGAGIYFRYLDHNNYMFVQYSMPCVQNPSYAFIQLGKVEGGNTTLLTCYSFGQIISTGTHSLRIVNDGLDIKVYFDLNSTAPAQTLMLETQTTFNANYAAFGPYVYDFDFPTNQDWVTNLKVNQYYYWTPTPTSTITPTATATQTWHPEVFTRTATITPTRTPTGTPTWTVSPTHSPTKTVSATFTSTSSRTETITVSPTATLKNTRTFTPTITATPTATAKNTRTSTSTATLTNTPRNTATVVFSRTFTPTITPTATVSQTRTSTFTFTATATETSTPIYTATVALIRTSTPTPTVTCTQTITKTFTPSPSISPTSTISPTDTCSPTISPTFTPSPDVTPTPIEWVVIKYKYFSPTVTPVVINNPYQ